MPHITYTIQEAAEIVHMGPNKLFQTLRDEKILDKNNLPRRLAVERGYLQTHNGTWGEYKEHAYHRPLLTERGLEWLKRYLNKGDTQLIDNIAARITKALGHKDWKLTFNPDGSGELILQEGIRYFSTIDAMIITLERRAQPKTQINTQTFIERQAS